MYEKWKLKTCDMYVWYIVCLIYTFVHCNEQYLLWECIMHTYLPWETILSRDMHIIWAWQKTYLFLVYRLYSSKKTKIDISVGVSIVTSKRGIFWIGSEHFVFTENNNSWQTYSSGAVTISYTYRALVIIPNFWWDSHSLIFSFF